MSGLPGVSGSLFPGRYLASGAALAAAGPAYAAGRQDLTMAAWWRGVEASCGPATAVREIFDVVASPLAARLGFRARDVTFGVKAARATLVTPADARVGLVVQSWAQRRSDTWRDLAAHAQDIGAAWCLLVAPPTVSVVDARGRGLRRAVDFVFPDALDQRSVGTFLAVAGACAFEGMPPPIDRLVAGGVVFQDRVRADLQQGVAASLAELMGTSTPMSRPHGGPPEIGFDEALTTVYRILFLLFAESRDLVPRHDPIYGASYTVASLCREALAGQTRGTLDGLAAICRLARTGCRGGNLIVQPFNGRLFARASAPALERYVGRGRGARRVGWRDRAIAHTLVSLGTRAGRRGREEISYADLGVEQLGAVYERVLDLDPARPAAGRDRRGARDPGHSARRKTTGTFYTPQPLADFVVRRTLAPLVAGAHADRILALRVVDPAMGSGAFLVSACRFLADAYERALVAEGRLAESDVDDHSRADFRRLIAERCLAGVDSNPVAVQVAQLSLWLASLARGRPLGFLDHRLRVGNSLVGAFPDDLRRVPSHRAAGRAVAALPLFEAAGLDAAVDQIAAPLADLVGRRDDTVVDVRAKASLWRQLTSDRSPLEPWRLAASLWCARWFWSEAEPIPPPSPAELRAALDQLLRGDTTLPAARLRSWTDVARRLARDHGFFHWPLEYPDIFRGTDAGEARARTGFDAVIGNPPWEMLRRDRGVDRTETGPRRQLLRYLRESGQCANAARSHVNLYLPFLERALALTRDGGRVGLILPWGFASDDGAAGVRRRLLDRGELDTIVGLDNAEALFPIHRGLRFVVVTTGAARPGREVRAWFGVRRAADIEALPSRDDDSESAGVVRLDAATIAATGGSDCRIPDLRRPGGLELLARLAREWPRLGSADGFGARFGRDLNATDDRGSLSANRAGLPVLEGKHIAPFVVDVGAATASIAPAEAARLLPDLRYRRPRLAYRDVSGVANRVTLIAAVLPPGVVTTHTLFCLRTELSAQCQHYLCGTMNSYVLNAVVRMLMGGHLTTGLIEDLPVPPWTGTTLQRRIAVLARRLGGPRTQDGDAGDTSAALQALVARLYGLDVLEFNRVLDGFPLVPRAERTRALDALARGAGSGARPTVAL